MNETDYNEKTCFDSAKILYNYPPKGKWIVVDIYTETRSIEVNIELHETTLREGRCFSIYQIILIKIKKRTFCKLKTLFS